MSLHDSFVPLPQPATPRAPAPDIHQGDLTGVPQQTQHTGVDPAQMPVHDIAADGTDSSALAGAPARPTGWGLAGRHGSRRPGKRLVTPQQQQHADCTPEQRLLLLDTWQRSGLPAGDFAALVGVSKYTLYAWKKKFDTQGPGGLIDQPRGSKKGSRLPEWMTIAGSSSATDCTPVNRRPWFWRCCGRR